VPDATELVVGGRRAQLQQDRGQVGDVNWAPDVVVEQCIAPSIMAATSEAEQLISWE
jgi:hypothetical protein